MRPDSSPPALVPAVGALARLLSPRVELARRCCELRYLPIGQTAEGGQGCQLPRFVFSGPPGGDVPLRLGIFAAIHGDEPESAAAACAFIDQLADGANAAEGYELSIYPVCNPTGFEDGTRHARTGRDLNREFWRGSPEPEVRLLERELVTLRFDGLVALHTDDTVDGVYAYVRGATLTEALTKPALAAAAQFLPLASGELIDGFPARDGLIEECFEGVLSNPAELHPAPFEIIFETPQKSPVQRQIDATVTAVHAILREYRELRAYGQNL